MSAKKSPQSVPRGNEDAVVRALSKIAAILLRIGFDSPRSEHLLRRAFVLAALNKARDEKIRATQSEIATLAGISRLEVRKMLSRRDVTVKRGVRVRSTRVDQIIEGWRGDARFVDRHGQPRTLKVSGSQGAFPSLVKAYGRDVTVRTLRNRLVREGVAIEKNGRISLRATPKTRTGSVAAAESDLRFLESQLEDIDFGIGKRTYTTRRIFLLAKEKKSIQRLRRVALERMSIVLGAFVASAEPQESGKRESRSRHRLIVSTTVAAEAEGEKE